MVEAYGSRREMWFRYARKRLGVNEAEEVVQEAVLRALNASTVILASPRDARRYVSGVLKNVIRERLRDRRDGHRRASEAPPEEKIVILPFELRPEARVRWLEILDLVATRFGAASVEVRAFTLRYAHGLRIREIAAQLGQPRSTVHDALQRVHNALRDPLE